MAAASIDVNARSLSPDEGMVATIALRPTKCATLPVEVVDPNSVRGRIPLTIWITPKLMVNVAVVLYVANPFRNAPLGQPLISIGVSKGSLALSQSFLRQQDSLVAPN